MYDWQRVKPEIVNEPTGRLVLESPVTTGPIGAASGVGAIPSGGIWTTRSARSSARSNPAQRCSRNAAAESRKRGPAASSGGKRHYDPAAERSWVTMRNVVRFAEQLAYDAIVVENVVEATRWVGRRGSCVAMAFTQRKLSEPEEYHSEWRSYERGVVWVTAGRNTGSFASLR
jgi:hypothetical protein